MSARKTRSSASAASGSSSSARAAPAAAPARQRCLVTGGCGFLGSYIVDKLVEEGHSVRVFDRIKPEGAGEGGASGSAGPSSAASPAAAGHGDVEYVQGDLTLLEEVADAVAGCTVVFHVASLTETWGKRQRFFDVNVLGTENVLKACVRHNVRALVYTSTPSVVIDGRNIVNGDESLPIATKFLDCYTETKAEAESMVLHANGSNEGRLLTCAIRPHAMFGPRDNHFFPQLIRKAREGKTKFSIGSGTNSVDFTYVGNAADAHVLAMHSLLSEAKAAAGQAYFITNGEPTLFWEFMRRVLTRLGYSAPSRRIPYYVAYALAYTLESVHACIGGWLWDFRPPLTRYLVANMCTDHWFSIEKARKDLGYVPRVSLEEALEMTVQYYREMGLGNEEELAHDDQPPDE